MTFRYTDAAGHRIEIAPDTDLHGAQTVAIWVYGGFSKVPVRIPVDRVEELIAGIRGTAHQRPTEGTTA